MSLGYHATLELLSSFACSDEDDGRGLGHETVELQQSFVLVVVLVDINVELLDALDGQILVSESKNVGIGREAVCVRNDVLGECGREEDCLTVLGKHSMMVSIVVDVVRRYSRLDTSALLAQTLLVKHVIGLIQDQDLDAGVVDQASPQHVCDSSWCANKNVRLVLLATP